MIRSIISEEVQASVLPIVCEEIQVYIRQEVQACVRPIVREEVNGIIREQVQSLFERIEGLVNDTFVVILAPPTIDTHAMDPFAKDPPAMDPSISDLPFNNPKAMDLVKAIVNDVVKVNTTL